MVKKCLAFCAVFATLFVTSNAMSQSTSCVFINNKQVCTRKFDPNGNMAGAAAGINGGMGAVGAGAGTQDNFNTDFRQIGYDGTRGNEDNFQPGNEAPDYQPGQGNFDNGGMGTGAGGFPNYGQGNFDNGGMGGAGAGGFPNFGQGNFGSGGVAMGVGAGDFYNPNFPKFDPAQFVQDFFRRRP